MQDIVRGRWGASMDQHTLRAGAVDLKFERDGQSMLGYLRFGDGDWTGQNVK